MSHNHGVIWSAKDTDNECRYGALISDMSCRETGWRDDKLRVDEPKSNCLGKKENYGSNDELNNNTCAENIVELRSFAPRQLKCKEAAYRGREGAAYHGKQSDEASYHIVNPVIVYPQRIENDTAGVETNKHIKRHPYVEKDGVLCNSFVIIGR